MKNYLEKVRMKRGVETITCPPPPPLLTERDWEQVVEDIEDDNSRSTVVASYLGDWQEDQLKKIQAFDIQLRIRLLDALKTLEGNISLPQPSSPSPTALDDGWMSTKQAAAYLNMGVNTLQTAVKRGTIKGSKHPKGSIRGRWKFKKSILDRHLQAIPRKQTPPNSLWE